MNILNKIYKMIVDVLIFIKHKGEELIFQTFDIF